MSLNVKNLNKFFQDDPKLAEGLKSIQDYVNKNVSPITVKKVTLPAGIDPTKAPG